MRRQQVGVGSVTPHSRRRIVKGNEWPDFSPGRLAAPPSPDGAPTGLDRDIGDRRHGDEYGYSVPVQAHESGGLLVFVPPENTRKHGRGEAARKRLRIRLLLISQPLERVRLKGEVVRNS